MKSWAPSVWLCDWDRRRKWKHFDLQTGRLLGVMDEPPGEEANRRFMGFAARCGRRHCLVYRSQEGVWFQQGVRRLRLDEAGTKLVHRSGCFRSLSRLELAGGEQAYRVWNLSIWRFVRPIVDPAWDDIELEQDDFLRWVANSLGDPEWLENIRARWKAVDQLSEE